MSTDYSFIETHISLVQFIFLYNLAHLVNNLWVDDLEALWCQGDMIHNFLPEPHFGPEALLKNKNKRRYRVYMYSIVPLLHDFL